MNRQGLPAVFTFAGLGRPSERPNAAWILPNQPTVN